ncbi:kinase-like domain-containing protein [Syncephalis plumigaleata]|nr:kinase-like domain-containing protein [Syncephalis plumigaleata]
MNTNIVKNEGKAYQKIYAAQKNKVPGSEYVVNTIASFPVKLNMAFVRKQYSQEAKELPNFFEDFFSEKGHCFITEYIQSETLRKYSTSLDGGDKRQKAIKLLPLMLQVLEGVKFLNSQGIAHRDLQPENILISNEQSGKRKATIIDFDSCENFDISKPPLATGSSNALIQYLPFEAVVGMQYNLLGVDSWQVGATFYEALAGVPPTTAVINAHNVHPGTEVSFILSNIIGKPFALPPVTNDPILRNAWKPLTDQLAPLLTIDPNKRSTVAGFLKDYRPASQGPPPPLPPR